MTPRLQFEASVRRVLEWLHDGDCYQVNLARAVHLPACDPWQAYQRLRQRSAPSYGAFLVLDDGEAVLCNSPELFLEVDGDRICTEPIKGTRPRSDDPIQDAAHFRALEQSPKERAELAMIVDLVRSDLGRVAQVGSVRWGPRRIRSHRHVHHASQPIEALLAKGADAWDALAATFPPGSVTGAPKVRACHRIQELEPTPRGVYCGTIGFARPGRAVFNVAIRTAVQSAGQLRYHVGGGVVAASEPTAEWWETVHKGRALAWALGDPDAYS